MLLIVGVGERIIATVRRMIELTELDKEVELLVIDLWRIQLRSATLRLALERQAAVVYGAFLTTKSKKHNNELHAAYLAAKIPDSRLVQSWL
jgi:hypoxanthine-guanine phosphoribosyltransferase